jgi:hypothetical protein
VGQGECGCMPIRWSCGDPMSGLSGGWLQRTGLGWRTSGQSARHWLLVLGVGCVVHVCWRVASLVWQGGACAFVYIRWPWEDPKSEPGSRRRKRMGLGWVTSGPSVKHWLPEPGVKWAMHFCWGVVSLVRQVGACDCVYILWPWEGPMSEPGGRSRKRTGLGRGTGGPIAKHPWLGLGAGGVARVRWGVPSPVAEGVVCAWFFSRRSSWSPRSEPCGRGRKRMGLRLRTGGLSVRHVLSASEVWWSAHVCWGVVSAVAQCGVCAWLFSRRSSWSPRSETGGRWLKRMGLRGGRGGLSVRPSSSESGVGRVVQHCGCSGLFVCKVVVCNKCCDRECS